MKYLLLLFIPLAALRPYNPITPSEKREIDYIINTLADKPTAMLLFYKSSLDAAGDRIRHIHPFYFLHSIFSDEVLKVNIRNIKNKGWVWGSFVEGFVDSFEDELAANNLTQFSRDFSKKIGIEQSIVDNYLTAHDWEGLIVHLMHHIPRHGDFRRYDF